MKKNPLPRAMIQIPAFLLILVQSALVQVQAGVLTDMGMHVIPYPQEIRTQGPDFTWKNELIVVLDKKASLADQFAADELIRDLKNEWNISARTGNRGAGPSIILTRQQVPKQLKTEGYRLTTGKDEVVIAARDEAGLFYGTQTFLQLIQPVSEGFRIRGIIITDWPEVRWRAIHYDTKHHQDKASYVRSFIKDLARFKVNMLVWEWEDKFAYPSHPEIGAPGAFTLKEMQDFTRYAQQFHIQIVPLVQGLGHVSFILKWPQYKSLREIPASNWEFCPMKQGSYDLLFDLWKDAIDATPGSSFIHIGSDETYELGTCDLCKAKCKEIGKSGLYQLFINKAADFLNNKNRKVMAWERPMGWEKGESPAKGIIPSKGLVFTESYDYETPGQTYASEARKLGYGVFAYDPNPGVVPLMVPYFYEKGEDGKRRSGSLEKSYRFLTEAARSGAYDGMICTSWDDDDLHNQMWMMHFANAAAYSWNSKEPGPDKFRETFFQTYYGPSCRNMDSLFELLNEGAYYFAGTMERNVWHYGEIGKTRIPDLPRGDAMEYDPFWNTEYKDKLALSADIFGKMNRVLQIIDDNLKAGVKHPYDFEIFRTSASLIQHTCLTYKDLSNLEYAIKNAHLNRFVDYDTSMSYLLKARDIVKNSLKRRDSVYEDLVRVYEITRLPKGMSTPDKQYFWRQDRARHFAFRRPDLTFLIYDEQKLDLEDYLKKLNAYIDYFKVIGQE